VPRPAVLRPVAVLATIALHAAIVVAGAARRDAFVPGGDCVALFAVLGIVDGAFVAMLAAYESQARGELRIAQGGGRAGGRPSWPSVLDPIILGLLAAAGFALFAPVALHGATATSTTLRARVLGLDPKHPGLRRSCEAVLTDSPRQWFCVRRELFARLAVGDAVDVVARHSWFGDDFAGVRASSP
jgi:hypothetical protein